uniref:Uncharacterized protein n=1 Tax=Siphoviridae sp. ctMgQ24 TaxID=2826263 RepID=A0A8S5QP02_9CAUD|nr:MAG TPA: hypothetical protein [Siphoviridae sp. ctMgQ24]
MIDNFLRIVKEEFIVSEITVSEQHKQAIELHQKIKLSRRTLICQ